MILRVTYRFLCLLTLVGVFASTSRAQSNLSEDFGALSFDGGTALIDFRLGSNLFGSGIGSGSFSRIHSALARPDGGSIFGNPALLTLVGRPQIGFETRFPLHNGSVGLGSTTSLPSSFRTKTDELLVNLSLPENVEPRYTDASFAAAGQPRQLAAFWMSWPVKKTVAVGFGYRQPLLISSKLGLSGFQTLLSGKKEASSNAIQVDLLAELSLQSTAEIQFNEISVGTGGLLEPYSFGSVWWGATLYRLGSSVQFGLDVLPQGVLTISGTDQFYFNDVGDPNLDPAKGETNAFFWKIRGGFKGSGVGARLGMMHRTFKEGFGTSLYLDLAPTIKMWDGDAFARSFMPMFIDLEGVIESDGVGEKDLLDIELLDLARPNQTRQTHDAIGQWMKIHMPTSLTGGIDLPFGRHVFVVNLTRYWGALAVEGEYGLEDGVLQRYKLGKKSTWGVKLGLDFGRQERQNGMGSWSIPLRILTLDIDGVLMELLSSKTHYSNPRYRFSGAVQWGEPVVYGLDNTFSTELEQLFGGLIPTSLSIGRSYTLFDRLDVGVHVIGVPDFLMRFSFGLNVD